MRRTSRSTTSPAALARVEAAGGTVTTGPTVAGGRPRGARSSSCAQEARGYGCGGRIAGSARDHQRPGAPGDHQRPAHPRRRGRARPGYTRAFGWEFSDLGFGAMIRVPG